MLHQSNSFTNNMTEEHYFMLKELPLFVRIDNDSFEAQKILHRNNIYHNILITYQIAGGAILICVRFSFALIWEKNLYIFLNQLAVLRINKIFENLGQ